MQSPGSLLIHTPEYSNRSLVNRVIQSQIGVWPDLTHLVGSEVNRVSLLPNGSTLVLELVRDSSPIRSERLLIPPYWVFRSSPAGFSSLDIFPDSERPKAGETLPETIEIPELTALTGARLTEIKSDHEHLDLVFDSLRISVIPEAF